MNFRQPIWQVAFRPLFALGCLAGALLPLIWMLIYAGAVSPAPTWRVTPMTWHAHEMFFGFGAAVLAGFLLTASKNWVAIRGYHGGILAALSGAWLLDRLALLYGDHWPASLFWLASSLFVATFVAMVLVTLLRYRGQDSYRVDNRYFILALPLLLPAKWLLLQPEHFATGVGITIAIFRLAFIIMLERTLSQFMNSTFRLTLVRRPVREHATKSLALLLIATPWLPLVTVSMCSLLCALLLFWRWLEGHPHQALRRIDIGIMVLGQLAIIGQLFLSSALGMGIANDLAGARDHLFTIGALGLVVPAMMVRISKGHTGRKVQFDTIDKAILWLMLTGLVLRTALPVLVPARYELWLWLTAAMWFLAFSTLTVRYIPWLMEARVDGREH